MDKWHKFWTQYPKREGNLDLYQQVGKTVGGKGISKSQTRVLVDDIVNKLYLEKNDRLLDLCCGNGLITERLADHVRETVGLDFSRPLIEQAQKNPKRKAKYWLHDVKQLDWFLVKQGKKFTKILSYEALAFFTPNEVEKLFVDMRKISTDNTRVMLGSILDVSCKLKFFNTRRRKLNYLKAVLMGKELGLGRWWNLEDLLQIANSNGFIGKVRTQAKTLHTSHYRKDILLIKKR